jgi:hypothetical protein
MKLTFKQFSQLSNLTEDQVTEEKLEEIFGAFFGGKSQPDKDKAVADLKAKKAGTQQAMNKNTAALAANKGKLDKNKEWMDWVASQNNTGAPAKPGAKPNVADKHGERRSSDFAYAQRGMKEAKETKIPYKGHTITKKDAGTYHITKGPRFIGHAKDHQEAMKKIDAEGMKGD